MFVFFIVIFAVDYLLSISAIGSAIDNMNYLLVHVIYGSANRTVSSLI